MTQRSRPALGGAVLIALTVAIGVVAVLVAQHELAVWLNAGLVGQDFYAFVAWGHRFLDTGSLYTAEQMRGPYLLEPPGRWLDRAGLPCVYPPTIAPLFVALTILPLPITALLWWGIPAAIVAYAAWRMPPPIWAWPLIALALAWPVSSIAIIVGNFTMWLPALVAAGRLWGWPAALIVVKPTFAPLALIGIRRRSWWLAMGIVALVSLALLPEFGRYLVAIHNVDVGWTHSLDGLPLVVIPLLFGRPEFAPAAVWAGREQPA